MFNKDKREERKNKLLAAYRKGYEKAEQKKNEEIRRLKIKYFQIIKSKDTQLTEQEKKVQRIEDVLNKHSDLVCETNSIIKRLKNNSYVHSMMIQGDHARIEGVNDEVELLELKVNKNKNKIGSKILEFKRSANE